MCDRLIARTYAERARVGTVLSHLDILYSQRVCNAELALYNLLIVAGLDRNRQELLATRWCTCGFQSQEKIEISFRELSKLFLDRCQLDEALGVPVHSDNKLARHAVPLAK